MFKLWSQTKPEVKKELKPDLGLRSWDDLTSKEKSLMWQHLQWYFFDQTDNFTFETGNWEFFGGYGEEDRKKNRIFLSVDALNETYKAQNYTPSFLDGLDIPSACEDFYRIFANGTENVVLELLAFYSRALLSERSKEEPYKEEGESPEDYKKRTIEWKFEDFDDFAQKVNEVFGDFGINTYITRQGFVPRQDKKITETIVEPVLSFLSDQKWQKVNEHFSESFRYYQNKDYGNSISNSISAVQAFLQIIVDNKIGKGNISELISKAQKESLIPNDVFTKQIFDNLESIFARERQSKSGVHPKSEIADEKTAKLILNLTMVFIQHCIQGT